MTTEPSNEGMIDRVLIRIQDRSAATNDSEKDTASCVMLDWLGRIRPDLLPLVRRTHVRQGVGSMKIDVRDNQIEPALKALKKQMLKDGLFQEMKRREHYEKPSVKRKRKQALARKKLRKAMKRVSLRSDE